MRNQYVMDINFDGGKHYSSSICNDEWTAFIKAWKGNGDLDGWVVPIEVLEEIWVPEYVTRAQKVTIRKVN